MGLRPPAIVRLKGSLRHSIPVSLVAKSIRLNGTRIHVKERFHPVLVGLHRTKMIESVLNYLLTGCAEFATVSTITDYKVR